jgi:AsmA-like C-terminal region
MSTRKKRWLLAIAIVASIAVVAVFIAASIIVKRFEPMVREQAIQYLHERFHSDVELTALHLHMPKMSAFSMVRRRGRGVKVPVDGEGLAMWFSGSRKLPPMFSIRKFRFVVDLGSLTSDRTIVDSVTVTGMQINLPPKGERPDVNGGSNESDAAQSRVLIKDSLIRDAQLVIFPKDKTRKPLHFQIDHLHLVSTGTNTVMNYDAGLIIPRPPGLVHSEGTFGPWTGNEPGDTPLNGKYTFDKADLGVFNGIAGTLASSGSFDGTLSSVHARGEAIVPDFRLKITGSPVSLSTNFEVLVDGTNGNTILQPVKARLGKTFFTTTGAVIKHEDQAQRTIELKMAMPNGDLRDLLRLAAKGAPFMEGRIAMNTKIRIPPLSGPVKQKLLLDGQFEVRDAKFLRSTIQSQLDQLSRRGQGQPENKEIDQVVSTMRGKFRLANQVMTFRSLTFGVPGADVDLAGDYNLGHDLLDFHGALKLRAKVSETMTGWKRWVLKPVDPFFSKNGAGTYLRIQVEGNSHQPKFGLDHGHKAP